MGQGGVPAWAVRGARVVCISDAWVHISGDPTTPVPKKGEINVLASVEIDHDFTGAVAVTLVGYGDGLFNIRRFRPLITRTQEQDVARFRKHLHPKRIRTDAIVKIPHHGPVS